EPGVELDGLGLVAQVALDLGDGLDELRMVADLLDELLVDGQRLVGEAGLLVGGGEPLAGRERVELEVELEERLEQALVGGEVAGSVDEHLVVALDRLLEGPRLRLGGGELAG